MNRFSTCLVVLLTALTAASASSPTPPVLKSANKTSPIVTGASFGSAVQLWEAILVFLAVGVLSAFVAFGFQAVRKYVYHDSGNLDTAFDAGGNISISLTASCIVSQWTWTATLLQSCTVAAKFGISGPYWYAGGATIQVIIFAILSIQLKTRAPGAKTFLQVIYARFGKTAHIVFCIFALLTNLIITTTLMVAGVAVIQSLVSDLSPDLAAFFLAVIIGTYTVIGGLGATFYVSYFNTALIYVLICWLTIEVFYNPGDNPKNPFTGSDSLYDLLSNWTGPAGNLDGSYLTFYSSGGLVFGIVNIVGNFGAVFCDQAYWQKSVAAKPLHGVWGFILGAVVWFAVPFALATTMGLAYLGLSSQEGIDQLTKEQVDSGLVAAFVSQRLLGKTGEFVVVVLILMAVMSTGSSEVIAVAAIIVYDIYQIYIVPFRPDLGEGRCILCTRFIHPPKYVKYDMPDDKLILCQCSPINECEGCKIDSKKRALATGLVKPHLQCEMHKDYREYLEHLLNYKNWWIVNATFLTVVFTLLAWYANLNLSWLYYFIGVLISAAVIPIAFSVTWTRATAAGVIWGSLGGLACALCSWIGYSSTLEGGLGEFIKNTGNEYSMLVGNIVAIGSGGLICVIVSIASKPHWTSDELEAEWEKTRNIDNPLSPWVESYKDKMKFEASKTNDAHYRPPQSEVERQFRPARLTAYGATVVLTLIFIIIWPVSMLFSGGQEAQPGQQALEVGILTKAGFRTWTSVSRAWAYITTACIVIVPVVEEVMGIYRQLKTYRRRSTVDASGVYKLTSREEF